MQNIRRRIAPQISVANIRRRIVPQISAAKYPPQNIRRQKIIDCSSIIIYMNEMPLAMFSFINSADASCAMALMSR